MPCCRICRSSRLKSRTRARPTPATPARLVDAAHTLASAAGMFGFLALAAASRGFEYAVAHDAPDTNQFARILRDEAQAALAALDDVTREFGRLPA